MMARYIVLGGDEEGGDEKCGEEIHAFSQPPRTEFHLSNQG